MTRVRSAWRHHALVSAAVVFVLAAAVLAAMHKPSHLALTPTAATRDALHAVRTNVALVGMRWNHMTVSAVDDKLVRVSFYDGARQAGQIALRANGTIDEAANFEKLTVPYGNWLAYEPGVLIGLAALFVLMAGVLPLRRLRNLDVLAALSLVVSVLLLKSRLVSASVLAAVPGLAYLMVRCAWFALRSRPRPGPPSTPLFDCLTARLTAGERRRVLRVVAVAIVLVVAMIGVTSTNTVDVVYAVMEGATKLIHGVLPYGHLPGDIVHGDTYPIGSYVLYAPLALLAPVNSEWNSVDIALGAGVLATLACAGSIFLAAAPGRIRFRTHGETRSKTRSRTHSDPHSGRDDERGTRAAIAFLSFPLVVITVSTGTTDVVLAALLGVAVLLWHRPTSSAGWLAAAGWFKLAPFALVPIWLAPLRGKQLYAAIAAIVGVSAAMLAVVVGLGGTHGPAAMVHALSFQFSRGSPQSLWSALGIEQLQPLGEAAVLALVAGAAVRLRREPELAADRTRIAALSAAVLLALQLSSDYWAFLYVAWALPLICLSLLSEPAAVPVAETVRPVSALPALLPLPSR